MDGAIDGVIGEAIDPDGTIVFPLLSNFERPHPAKIPAENTAIERISLKLSNKVSPTCSGVILNQDNIPIAPAAKPKPVSTVSFVFAITPLIARPLIRFALPVKQRN